MTNRLSIYIAVITVSLIVLDLALGTGFSLLAVKSLLGLIDTIKFWR